MREVILGGRESRNYNFVQYEPLIWGASEQGLRSLTSLCGYVPTGGRARVPAAPFPSGVRSINELCGISAQFGGGHGIAQRVIGLQKESDGGVWREENSSHFEIDGPGGEYLNEISVNLSNKPPNGLKLRTNRNREFIWGDHQTGVWETFQAPEGEIIVGMILTFGKGVGRLIGNNKYTRTKMRSLSALTMPLGIADGD
ncbi:hypothetical protein HYALB_00001960 [Hymenoscyphus albidus]|uniref:Uncharacterized protein n=1 Tax=Hymenoscyphus albidus TaxID=595503 RepID=A0A9N9Q1M9_9HELO|nr:hypothetical protein HYALB_00001960 [Hymenoscyphus albidus]